MFKNVTEINDFIEAFAKEQLDTEAEKNFRDNAYYILYRTMCEKLKETQDE